MFVPSTWQHEVDNLETTISINHNWITFANIDQTFNCLLVELKDIHRELKEWGMSDSSTTDNTFLEASESMLRGCVGLNITSFFLMLLWRLSQLLLKDDFISVDEIIDEKDDKQHEIMADREFECRTIARLLQAMMSNDKLQLKGRIEAVLSSKMLSLEAIRVAKVVLDHILSEESQQ